MSLAEPTVEPEEHWVKDPLTKCHEDYLPLTDREFFCNTCRSKCTLTTEQVEVGHAGNCPHRSGELPAARHTPRLQPER